ncbi:MAG: YajQ family cyclic di-GMP-binding protein [Mariprofundaceae bacterium]
MPTFDVVSEVDMHEIANAVDQSSREVGTRFDFKGVDARFELNENVVAMVAEAEFQLQQMLDILRNKLVKRGVDMACLQLENIEQSGKQYKQDVILRHGLDTPLAKSIVKKIKEAKIKVQASIQGEQVRVSGKKRDDLQGVIAMLREAEFDMPLQFVNFRD